jgi:hypothetical protein
VLQKTSWLAALVLALSSTAAAQVAILQIQVIEGEGVVHAPDSRSTRPLAVEVTDEAGRPVAGAAVTFHLPETGPGGVFTNGLRTEVALTDSHGHAAVRGLQLNRSTGPFQIRIVASKEQARAGTVSFQYIDAAKSGTTPAVSAPVPASRAGSGPAAAKGHSRWIVVAALVGGGAVAGILAGARSGAGNSAASPALPQTTIGNPTITVGKP